MNIKVQNWFVERQEEWNKKRRNGPVREDISPLRNGKADSSNVKESSSKGKEDAEVPRGIISVLEKKLELQSRHISYAFFLSSQIVIIF